MSKNIILADHDVNESWDFLRGLSQGSNLEWELNTCISNRLHGNKIKIVLRYLKYFCFSFSNFMKRKQFENIVAWQQFYGLLIAFFCRAFKVKHAPKIYVMTFIYKPKNQFYERFIRYIVTSGYITKLIVNSDSEREYYSKLFNVDENLFYCTRIGVADYANLYPKSPKVNKYYLSVGRSNRDYQFLVNAWKEEYGDLIIICDSFKDAVKGGIKILDHCYGNEYFEYLSNCYALIIALEDPNISSGCLSFLQAMMLSVPVIVTENITVHDYIEDGINGFIIPKDRDALREKLIVLENKKEYSDISHNGRKKYEEQFSELSLGKDIGKMVSSLT